MKPVTVNEIEFYVSNDGLQTGLSQNGLALLCGIDEKSIRKLLDKLNSGSDFELIESLRHIPGKDLWYVTDAQNNAKVVKAEYAAKVIEYYAFESKASNNTAKYSFRKFATMGIEKWIKEITGYEEKQLSTTDDLLKQLLLKFDGLEKETKELGTIRGKTKTCYIGLDNMLDTLSEEENLLPSETKEELEKTYTLTEWLREYKGINDLSSGKKHSLALSISQTYNQLKEEKPKRECRRSKDGKINNGVSVYTLKDFWILEKSFSLVMLTNKIK